MNNLKIVLIFIYNLVCIAIVLFPTILNGKELYFLIVLVFTFSFTLDFFLKNKSLKIFNYVLKLFFYLFAIFICFLISRYAYFINSEIFILLFIILGIIYFYRIFFLKKIYFPLIFPATCIFISAVVFQSFYVNRDNEKYKKILIQKYLKPLLVFNKNYSKKYLYLVNAGSPKKMLTDEKEKYLFVTFQDPPLNSYSVIRLNFKTLSNLKVLFGEASRDPAIYKDKIFVPIYQKKQVIVVDINTFQIIKKIPVKYNLLREVLIDEKNNKLYTTSEVRTFQIFNLQSLKLEKKFLSLTNPYVSIIDEVKQKMYVTGGGGTNPLIEIDLKNLRITRTIIGWPWWFILGSDINRKANILYVVETSSGYLKTINISTFKTIKNMYVSIGVREVVLDKKRNLLYVGNFLTGNFYIIDAKNYKILNKIYVGDKIRCIYITPKTNKVLVGNVYGVFEVKVDELIKKNLQFK